LKPSGIIQFQGERPSRGRAEGDGKYTSDGKIGDFRLKSPFFLMVKTGLARL